MAQDRKYKNLIAAHDRQLVRKGAFPGNHGWVVTETAYLSKTDKGCLETIRIAPGKYQHKWTAHSYDDTVIDPPDHRWDFRDRLRALGL